MKAKPPRPGSGQALRPGSRQEAGARPGTLALAVVSAIGTVGWSVYKALLFRRSLHMLQLESYQTARFLRWWVYRPTRLSAPRQALGSCVGMVGGILVAFGRGRSRTVGALIWSGLGVWLAASTRFPDAKKPLVMTARARRLAAATDLLGMILVAGPSFRRPANSALSLSMASLITPLFAAAANLLLFPLEEALRRYYLHDAAAKLRRLAPTVVAVAGSYGKTSTKEFLATILEARYEVLRPPGSHNTPMGLSRIIREQLTPKHEIFIAELGDWVPGDIALLCRVLRPRIGVLTSIGPEHLERFKTMQRVEASKLELLRALPVEGAAVINQDDEIVRCLGAETSAATVVRYGLESPEARVRARRVRATREGLEFVVEADGSGEVSFRVPVLGRHNASNLLAAISVALVLGMKLEEVAAAARRIRPVEHRLQPINGAGGVLIIDDGFNSNPRGAAAALDVLGELEARQRILVTPGMVELAQREFEENRRFGQLAAKVCDAVVVVGQDRAPPLVAGLRAQGFPDGQVHVVRDLAEATARLSTLVRAGDVVLFENDLPDTYSNGPETPMTIPVSLTAPPTPRQRRSLKLNGLTLAYLDSGETGACPRPAYPPVVVLHGWGSSADAMAAMQAGLSGQLRVLTFDLPGFGQSDPPPAAWDSMAYAELIKQALDRLELSKVSLIGHSFGGKISILLALRWPELVHRMVLVNSAGIRPTQSAFSRARVAVYKTARRLAGGGELANWLARRFGSADYRAAGPLRPTLVRVVNEDLRNSLPAVRTPTLLIWGDRDRQTPLSDAAILEREIPDAGLVVFSGAGHFAYLDDLPRFCRVVGHFLKSPASGDSPPDIAAS